jgi:hypothetical protein
MEERSLSGSVIKELSNLTRVGIEPGELLLPGADWISSIGVERKLLGMQSFGDLSVSKMRIQWIADTAS